MNNDLMADRLTWRIKQAEKDIAELTKQKEQYNEPYQDLMRGIIAGQLIELKMSVKDLKRDLELYKLLENSR